MNFFFDFPLEQNTKIWEPNDRQRPLTPTTFIPAVTTWGHGNEHRAVSGVLLIVSLHLSADYKSVSDL